jgi:hypothetical protein
LPSVGKNLSDHVQLANLYNSNSNDTWNGHLAVLNEEIGGWLATHHGAISNTVSDLIGWFKLPSTDPVLREHGDPSTGPTSAHFELIFVVCPPTCL